MKKMLAVSLVLAAALAMGCSKKNPQTTPNTGGTQTEMKSGSDMGGATYGGNKASGGDPCAADPCAAPK